MNKLKGSLSGIIGLLVSVSAGASPGCPDLFKSESKAAAKFGVREDRSNLVLDPTKAVAFPFGSIYGRNIFVVEDGIILTTGHLTPYSRMRPDSSYEFQMISQDSKNRTNPKIRALFKSDYRFESLIQVGPDAYLAIKYFRIDDIPRHLVLLDSRGNTKDVVTINFDVAHYRSSDIHNYLKFQSVNGRHFLTDALGSVKLVEYDSATRTISFRALDVPENLLGEPVVVKRVSSDGIVAEGRYDLPIVWKAERGQFKLQPTESYPVYDKLLKFLDNGERIIFDRRAETTTINPGTKTEIKIATADFLPETAFKTNDGFYVFLGNEINKTDPMFRKTRLLVVAPDGTSFKVDLPNAGYVKFENFMMHSNGSLIGAVLTNQLSGLEPGAYRPGDVIAYQFDPSMRFVRASILTRVPDSEFRTNAQISELPSGNLLITESYDGPAIIIPLVPKK